MIRYTWDLFYDVFNITVQEKLTFLYLILSEPKSYFKISSASSLIMISMISLSECITCSSSISVEEIKLLANVNWIFHVSRDF